MDQSPLDSSDSDPAPDRLSGQLRDLETALDQGQLRDAAKYHREIHQARLSDPLKERFRLLSDRLHELQNRRAFVTMPKRRALCERMVALGESRLDPEQKARKIKQLHKEWQCLGPANSRDDQRLWARFKTASDAAYAPCATHFAVQDAEREANRLEKVRICEALEDFVATTEWTSIDYPQVSSMLHQSHTAWHNTADIPRRTIRPLNRRFFAAIRPIQAQLEQEQTRNHEHKRQLIEALRLALRDQQDSQELAQYARRLQAQWKQVGVTDRATDQKLCKSFQSACNAAFERCRQDDAEKQRQANNRHQ